MTIFDSSGIEAWVTENNPKFAKRIIKQLKAYAKANHFDSNYDPYKATYGSMPTHSAANDQIKPLYVDGHSAMLIKLALLLMVLALSVILIFTTKIFWNHILNSFRTRNLILPMKINQSMMQDF